MSNNVSSSQEFVDRYDDIYRQFIELKNDYEKLYYGRDLSELNRLKEHMENTKSRAFENAEGSDFTEHRKLMDQFKKDPSTLICGDFSTRG